MKFHLFCFYAYEGFYLVGSYALFSEAEEALEVAKSDPSRPALGWYIIHGAIVAKDGEGV